MLRSRGIAPSQLQPAEDVNIVERRLISEEKKALPKKSKKKEQIKRINNIY